MVFLCEVEASDAIMRKEYTQAKEIVFFSIQEHKQGVLSIRCTSLLGSLYYDLQQIDSARYYKLLVLHNSQATTQQRGNALSILKEIEKQAGKYEEALQYATLYQAFSDSVLMSHHTHNLPYIAQKFRFDQLMGKQVIQKVRYMVTVACFGILAICGFFGARYVRKRNINALVLSANEKLAVSQKQNFELATKGPAFDPNTWTYVGTTYDEILVSERIKAIPGGWHQHPPFNDSLPFVPGIATANGRAYTGCTVIATAQIMSFWKKPHGNYITQSTWTSMISNLATSVELKKLIKDIFNTLIVANLGYGATYYNTSGTSLDASITFPVIRACLNTDGITMGNEYTYSYGCAWDALNYGPTYMEGFCGAGHAWVVDGAREVVLLFYDYYIYQLNGITYEHKIPLYYSSSNYKYVRCDWGWGHVGAPGTTLPINTWFPDGVFTVQRNSGTIYNFNSSLRIASRK